MTQFLALLSIAAAACVMLTTPADAGAYYTCGYNCPDVRQKSPSQFSAISVLCRRGGLRVLVLQPASRADHCADQPVTHGRARDHLRKSSRNPGLRLVHRLEQCDRVLRPKPVAFFFCAAPLATAIAGWVLMLALLHVFSLSSGQTNCEGTGPSTGCGGKWCPSGPPPSFFEHPFYRCGYECFNEGCPTAASATCATWDNINSWCGQSSKNCGSPGCHNGQWCPKGKYPKPGGDETPPNEALLGPLERGRAERQRVATKKRPVLAAADGVCSDTQFCCPEAKHCLTATKTSCLKDASACASGEVCCPVTKLCVKPGVPCNTTCHVAGNKWGINDYCSPTQTHVMDFCIPCDTVSNLLLLLTFGRSIFSSFVQVSRLRQPLVRDADGPGRAVLHGRRLQEQEMDHGRVRQGDEPVRDHPRGVQAPVMMRVESEAHAIPRL